MNSLFDSLQNWRRDVQHFPIGTIQELRFDRASATTSRNGCTFTTFEFLDKFHTSSIAYVGISSFTDKEIDDLGITSDKINLSFSATYMVAAKLGLSCSQKQLSTLRVLPNSSVDG